MNHQFSAMERNRAAARMKAGTYDVCIIGGGITGAGIALDAASRGMKVALVEMQDFASGTSSRSTKLVHGGLRYLKQFEIKEVGDLGKERAIVYENGPHVTTPEWMLLPIHRGGTFGKWSTSLGLKLYDYLARVKKAERRSMLNKEETLDKEPLIKQEGLKGGGYYVEYRTDDARLTIEVAKAAAAHGADLLNYAKASEFICGEDGRIETVLAKDQLTGETFRIQARHVVNAAGPWVDTLRDLDRSKDEKHLKLSKGVHIVIDQSVFPLKQSVYFDTPDGRMVFAIPRDGKAYIGTTDTFYEGDPASPAPLPEDRNYLLKAIHYMFPSVRVTEEDIESSWAGVRPLIHEEGKSPSEISRKDEIWESPTGLITIAGGKLTGYRKMAETVTDLIALRLSERGQGTFASCRTKELPISGGDMGGSSNYLQFIEKMTEEAAKFGLDRVEGRRLASIYGTNTQTVFRYAAEGRPGLPAGLYAQLLYAIEHEMCTTPSDFFVRRTGLLYFDIDLVQRFKDKVIDMMSRLLGWEENVTVRHRKDLEGQLKTARFAANN